VPLAQELSARVPQEGGICIIWKIHFYRLDDSIPASCALRNFLIHVFPLPGMLGRNFVMNVAAQIENEPTFSTGTTTPQRRN
jgi:hypothetical protein